MPATQIFQIVRSKSRLKSPLSILQGKQISAPYKKNRPCYQPKFKISANPRMEEVSPPPRFCGRVMRQQSIYYGFRRVVLDLYISGSEHIK